MKQSKKQLELLEQAKKTEQKIQLKETAKQVDFGLNLQDIPQTRTLVTALTASSVPSTTQKTITNPNFIRTDSLQHKTEIELIKNRHVLDPKRHYKKLDKITTFQVGKIIDSRGTLVSEMQSERYKQYVNRRVSQVHSLRNNVTRKGKVFKRKW